ncbi:hypothetical protein ACH35V_21175 [Actinomadura sp. 1N219]|uniref:hypothetical protein n=1 Tax=Actinomadura sp. 1N219 TaxID=3375152 RepID=UPI0037A3F43A
MTPQERKSDIAARKRQATGAGKQAQHKIWVRDAWAYYDVWEVPIERLVLNVDNKRFSSERELVEHKLGRPLDPANNQDDESSIIAILCDSSLDVDFEKGIAVGTPSKDFLALRQDWQARGQAEPLWIRPDGTVRNGNRRLAMLKRQRSDGADLNWVDAIILSTDDVDESELFRMEQREQLTENFKKRYQDVNALLALKDAANLENIDWDDADSIAAVASRLKHYAGRDDASYASKQLYAIRALDNYLSYINAPGRYSLAARQVEVFREVGLCLSAYEDEPDQQFELLQAAYASVQAGCRYREIRQLRKLFGSDRTQFDAMMQRILKVEEESGWDPEVAQPEVDYPELSDATAPDSDESEEDDLSGVIGPEDYPKREVGEVIAGTLDRFAASSLDVKRQLDQAHARLDAVDLSALIQLQDDARDAARNVVRDIQTWAGQALEALG